MYMSSTGFTPAAASDFSKLFSCSANYCGMGVYITGFDSNGITVRDLWTTWLGIGHTETPSDFGTGGHTIWDRGLRNRFYDCYAQATAAPAYYSSDDSSGVFYSCDSENGSEKHAHYLDIFHAYNTIVRPSIWGINYAHSSTNINVVDPFTQNTSQYQAQIQTTTSSARQELFRILTIDQHKQSVNHIVVSIQGKRNGNHASYVNATCVAERGCNGTNALEKPPKINNRDSDVWTVTHWGSEDSLAGLTFEIEDSGVYPVVYVISPPAYAVDWSITIQMTRRVS
jgi:hypothetical protein